MKRKQWGATLATALLALSLSACQSAHAALPTPTGTTIPHIVIKAHDFSFDLPQQIDAGLVEIRMTNDGKEPHQAQFARLNDGVTMAQFTTALKQGLEAIAPLVTFAGGPGVIDPGQDNVDVVIYLQPGHYVALCFVPGSDHLPHLTKGMIAPFDVVAAQDTAAAQEPQADQEVKLLDFSYALPPTIKPGKQTWKISNVGKQPHEIMVMKLGEGKTMDDVMAFLQKPAGAPPFTDFGGLQAINSGAVGWLNLDLPAGTYIAICHVPDPATHKAHAALGMMLPFTVNP
ncbi:MAG: hypothetical protein U0350_43175 [Caldilineaceae bacterium]